MQLVDLFLQQRAHILAHGIRNIKALGPPHEKPSIDTDLIHWKTKRKAQTENLLFPISLRLGPSQNAANMSLIMLIMMLFKKHLNLLGQKTEQFLRRPRRHDILRNLHLTLSQAERGVAMQLDRPDTEIRPTKI